MKCKSLSCVRLFETHGLWPASLSCPWNSLGKNTGVGSHSLLQGIFPTQGLNPSLPHCRWILYCLNHQGSPLLEKFVLMSYCTKHLKCFASSCQGELVYSLSFIRQIILKNLLCIRLCSRHWCYLVKRTDKIPPSHIGLMK